MFRVLFNYHYTHAVMGATAAPVEPAPPPGIVRTSAPFPAPAERVQGYELIVHIAAYDDGIYVTLEYVAELFRPEAAERLLDGYLATVRRALGLPET